ncbi:tRNA uridine-5-carboxymethylaminomethyl(34) synthesis GTPase MnmE [Salinisphaera sp. USBA-960]|nr:tRNA uridine-5-carboxymethylaminomethyl(34) synthesis GTPase MnmE [Salifodinibacter halophilus]NNC27080.1 tRNA uridine-5-carboxymethylaminomethyl(34) synthesis GTPase MnmE [Salifodinibacter halophilus]
MSGASARPDTIAALASGRDRAGIAVIRVSGPGVRQITPAIIGDLPAPRHAVHRSICSAQGSVIDYGLALFFAAPASFTGEDVLELQGHGSPVVADAILARLFELGARPAEAGEFSRRAFENNRLSLDQAEATADVIAAESAAAATAAVRSLEGEFATRANTLTRSLTELRAWIEGALDFPDEEDVDWLADGQIGERLNQLQIDLSSLSREAGQGARLRDGLRIAILGRPNAGKSSLVNTLARRETAIVTTIPGTTRDVVTEQVELNGLPATLVDTAGLRDSDNPIELEGMRRARNAAEHANHVLYVFDAHEGLCATDRTHIDALPAGVGVTLIANKTDLTTETEGGRRTAMTEQSEPVIALSAVTGVGLETLIDHLGADVARGAVRGATFSARRRHLDALARAEQSLQSATTRLVEDGAPELVAQELADAQASIGEITGAVSRDDLLGEIFATFCIGK